MAHEAGVAMSSRVEIRVRGRLSDETLETFEEFTGALEQSETVMRGEVRDQAELHGLINQLQALGLELVEIRRLGDD